MERTRRRPRLRGSRLGRSWLSRTAGGAVAVLAAGALSLAGLAGTAHAADIDVARNGGFESGLANWSCTAGTTAVVSSPVHGGSAALACIQLQGGLDPSQVGIGVPASPSAAGSGYVAPSVVDNALDCLTRGTGCGSYRPSTTWPGVRGAMAWSTNWDASAGITWSSTVGGHVHPLP